MTAPDLTLRVVMVSADITDDIDAGLELNAEPTVILQGSVEAVKAAAKLFGEQVAITRAPLAEALAVPEMAALVKCLQREPTLTWIIENTSQVRIRDLALDMLEQQRAALRAIGERERDDARAYAAEVRMREKRAEDARISAEARLDATKDKAEAAILDLMAERDRAEARLAKAVEALRVLIDHTHNCEKELTEELHHADFCGESLPLTNARTALKGAKP